MHQLFTDNVGKIATIVFFLALTLFVSYSFLVRHEAFSASLLTTYESQTPPSIFVYSQTFTNPMTSPD
jgi:hypothetical protein